MSTLACIAGGIVGARNKVLAAERLEGCGEAARSTGHIAKQKFPQNFEQRENTIKKLYVYENLSQF